MARVALDADVVIAFLDPTDDQHARAVAELKPRLEAGDELIVGATAYAETMVRPLQQGSAATVDAFLDDAGIAVAPVDRSVARHAAHLRAHHASLRLPDAMSLATAQVAGATLLTLDKKLQRLAKPAE
jgi:predicted nucleic acid-binding protein